MANVLFNQLTQQSFNEIDKNDNAIYFVTDTQRLYLGTKLYSSNVTIQGTVNTSTNAVTSIGIKTYVDNKISQTNTNIQNYIDEVYEYLDNISSPARIILTGEFIDTKKIPYNVIYDNLYLIGNSNGVNTAIVTVLLPNLTFRTFNIITHSTLYTGDKLDILSGIETHLNGDIFNVEPIEIINGSSINTSNGILNIVYTYTFEDIQKNTVNSINGILPTEGNIQLNFTGAITNDNMLGNAINTKINNIDFGSV